MKLGDVTRRCALFLLASTPLACTGEQADGINDNPALSVHFDLVEAPDVFDYSGLPAIADDVAPEGLWAAVPGLPRPERGIVRSPATGRSVLLALFRAPAGSDLTLSAASAARLGLADAAAAPVVVRAVRSEARLTRNNTAF